MHNFKALSLRCAALATLTAVCAMSHAGRPLVTEDAAVLGQGECEWESHGARTQEMGTRLSLLNTQVGCGVGARMQVAASVGQAKADGVKINLTSLNGKTNLFKTTSDATALTLAWGIAGAKANGAQATSLFLNGVMTHQYNDKVTAHLNLGWNQQRTNGVNERYTNWSLASEYNLGKGLELMAEVVGVDDDKPLIGAGFRFAASKAWSLNASVHTNTSGPRVTTLTAGAKWSF
jgi:hypothetical protein